MLFQSRNYMLTAVLSIVIPFLATFYNFKTASTLYCVSPTSSYTVTTLDSSLPHATCFRVQFGVFTEVLPAEVGNQEEAATYLDGYVLPGVIESHGHILQYGEMLESVSLFGAKSIQEVRRRIKDYLNLHQGDGFGSSTKWLRGIGWDQAYFGGVMPTAVCILSRCCLA
jgi:predicted amidohydrolase YtcJ